MFSDWLRQELKRLKIDISVYHSYLIGILEDNIDDDEKRETVTDIISSLIENDTESFVKAIFEKWYEANGAPAQTSNGTVKKQEEVDIAKLLETQAKIVNQTGLKKSRQISDEERRIKEQILANYSQTTVKEEDEFEEAGGAMGEEDENDPDLEANTNKADVQKLAREKREQARMESAAKKLKDKEDRAKQKATREDKKNARKAATVKGERKR